MSMESLAELLPREISALNYRPIFIFQIQVNPPSVIGATPGHDRRIGEITGGRFEGEQLRGETARPFAGTQSGHCFDAAITSGSARSSASIGLKAFQRLSRSGSWPKSERVLRTKRSMAFSL